MSLTASQFYRLPTDAEWSAAVGLQEDSGGTPKSKDMKIKGVYPWGSSWPPPSGAGNYADRTAKSRFSDLTPIEDYEDGFATTSSVGSFKANEFGLFDMGGNVWQWCEDWFNGEQKSRVWRGASWCDYNPDLLLSSRRLSDTPDDRNIYGGFRCVLVGDSSR